MKKVVVLFDVDQNNPNIDVNTFELIKLEDVSNGNIGLKKLYELINCDVVERINLGRTKSGLNVDLIIDEEGTFGRWSRGISIELIDRRSYELYGNSVCVIGTDDGDWVGFSSPKEANDAISELIVTIKLFEETKSNSVQNYHLN